MKPIPNLLTAAALAAVLSACGGGTDQEPPTATAQSARPLMDDEGRPVLSEPAAVPADAAARIRSGHYATIAQAQALKAALGDRAITLDVACCAGDAELAVQMAWVEQAAHDLTNAAPVLVHGADQRLAAAVAQRLADAGLSRVWLVTL